MPDKLIEIHSSLRPLFSAMPKLGQKLARKVYRNLLKSKYGRVGVAEVWQNGRLWKLYPEVALRGEYQEFATIEWLRKVVHSGMDVLDIGANVGQMTLEMAYLVGSEGRVVAVEPGPGNIKLLRGHIQANGFSERVTIVEAACASKADLVLDFKIIGNSTDAVGSGFSIASSVSDCLNQSTNEFYISVPSVTIDSVCSELQLEPSVIKIDVEGAELLVLKGAVETLHSSKPIVCFGFHPFAFPDPIQAECEIRSIFSTYEYQIYTIDGELAEQPFDLNEYLAYP